jgi:hypothetical protein
LQAGEEPSFISTGAAAARKCANGVAPIGHFVGMAVRKFAHVALLIFILGKSAAPMKELFTAAPWLHYYDDYFFVNVGEPFCAHVCARLTFADCQHSLVLFDGSGVV